MRAALRRAARWLSRLVAVIVVSLSLLWAGANIGPGRHLIEALVARVSDGTVRIEGLSGQLPAAIRIGRLTVADAAGPWLVVDDAVLDWSPARLLTGEASIDRLTAEHAALSRMPAAGGAGDGALPPVRVDLRQLHVNRLDIGPEVAGHAITLTADGSGEASGRDTGAAHLVARTIPRKPDSASDSYTLDVATDPTRLHATLAVAEAAGGLLSGLAGLPDLGPVSIDATADGPPSRLATKVAVIAGPLRANAEGTLDPLERRADLTLTVTAPAMRPRPDVAWSSVQLSGRVSGAWEHPAVAGSLTIADLTAAGAGIGSVTAELSGPSDGAVTLHGSLADIRLPGPNPALLAGGPVTLDASTRLDQPGLPTRFKLNHELGSATGTADLGQARFKLAVPDVAPFAAASGLALAGHADLDIAARRSNGSASVNVQGAVGVTSGPEPLPALIGDAATVELAASGRGDDIALTRLAVHGQALDVTVAGRATGRQVSLDWTTNLPSLATLRPNLSGTAEGHGHVDLTPDVLSATSDLSAEMTAEGYHSGAITAHVVLEGPPASPAATLTASGTLLDAPLELAVGAAPHNGGAHVVIDRATWKSLTASGELDIAPGVAIPAGKVVVSMGRLGDLSSLLGRPIAGEVAITLETAEDVTRINGTLAHLAIPGLGSAAAAKLNAAIASPLVKPRVDATLTADGVIVSGASGSGRLTGNGPLDNLALNLSANLASGPGGPAGLEASGALNVAERILRLNTMTGTWRGQAVRLLTPARIAKTAPDGGTVSIDQVRLGLRDAVLEVAGRVGDTLDARVRLTNLPLDVAAAFAPDYAADGTLSGEAALTGSIARPGGTMRLRATGMRLRAGGGRALPVADAAANVTLSDGGARLDAAIYAGPSNLSLTGVAPLRTTAAMDLRSSGNLDLAMFEPLLAARGRSLRGRAALAIAITGTPAAPRATGTVRLAGGEFSDLSLGAHVSGVSGTVELDGDRIRLTQVTGQAGAGTISLGGGVTLTGDRPVSLTVRARDARLLASDLATVTGDADLSVAGVLNGPITVGGTISVHNADIRVPERLPAGIAVLKVRIAGQPYVPPPPPPEPPDITLNVTLDAPERIYVRGRGLDAELGGRIVFGGTAARPVANGGLHLRRGTVSLAGVSLALTSGDIDFTGHPLTDPRLNLVATSSNATMTSTLSVSGAVRDPKLTLSSVPSLPSDEILAQLLFGAGKAQLSPFQVAQIAAALASLSGVGPSFGDPLEGLRSTLGLDQLSVGSSGGNGGGPTLEAGRYLMRGVRLGASQSATGGGTQGTVEIDLTKRLKLETTAGRSNSTATAGGNAASIGLKYQLEY